jgi:hypothetical protein
MADDDGALELEALAAIFGADARVDGRRVEVREKGGLWWQMRALLVGFRPTSPPFPPT